MTLASYHDVSGRIDEAVQPQKPLDVVRLVDSADPNKSAVDAIWRQARLLRDEWRSERYRRLSGD
jgi:hypothetical protein